LGVEMMPNWDDKTYKNPPMFLTWLP